MISKSDIKVALIQSDLVWENIEDNLINFDKKITRVTDNPDLIVLPEMFATGFTMDVEKCAEKENGKIVGWLKEQAKRQNCVIVGSVLIEDKGKYFNRMFWMKPDGVFETYDKRHLFRMGNEHKTMSQGTVRKIVELNGWKINLQICYDLRFPVWAKNNCIDGSYEHDALLYIANWPEVRSHAYKSLLLARAIENQCYVVWVNRVGDDGNKNYHTGDSMIVDPFGKIILQAEAEKEQTLSGVLSKNKLEDFRDKFKVGMDWDRFNVI
ncbi:MAG: amidohydrolase [Bacteroidetes bacterium]|nr:MAG: amidohydrolase [Bacteroidota bacterium]